MERSVHLIAGPRHNQTIWLMWRCTGRVCRVWMYKAKSLPTDLFINRPKCACQDIPPALWVSFTLFFFFCCRFTSSQLLLVSVLWILALALLFRQREPQKRKECDGERERVVRDGVDMNRWIIPKIIRRYTYFGRRCRTRTTYMHNTCIYTTGSCVWAYRRMFRIFYLFHNSWALSVFRPSERVMTEIIQ